jgi:hypothetical protein
VAEWDSVSTPEELFDLYKSAFVHEPDLMIGFQFGVDLDEFCGQIDPLQQFLMIREISATGMIHTPYDMGSMTDNDIKLRACIAAAQLSNSLPINMDPSLSIDNLSELKLSSKEVAAR